MPERPASVSALLAVHRAVAPAHLAAAVASLLAQTRPVDEVVVVQDGPLDRGHLAVLDDVVRRHPRVVREVLGTNQGAGVANQAGLLRCTGDWVLKVDADDVSAPDRVERLLAAVDRRGLDVCGSAMLEFEVDPEEADVLRATPLEHAQVVRRMRANNPFNHPTVLFRRDLAVRAGGYPAMRFMQDYVLFARMAGAGARMGNVPEPLVRFRAGAALHRRRTDRRFTRLERELLVELRRARVVGPVRGRVTLLLRLAYRRLPAPLMRWAHRHLLARPGRPSVGEAPTIPITAEVLRRQARMAGRSLLVLARRPSTARDLPRLLATRGRGTVRLRLPWLPFRLVDELGSVVGAGSRVFEYGGGGSTLWYLDHGAEVVTVEHHRAWADALEGLVSAPGWTLLRRSADHDYDDYVRAVTDYPEEHFDVVVVDGRERARCLLAAVAHVRPGGLLVLDDSDRARYAEAARQVPWPREDVVGFAPAKPTLAYTTVFRRPRA